jgi:hypothetical protein
MTRYQQPTTVDNMTDQAVGGFGIRARGSSDRAERLDRAVSAVQTRCAPMYPGGETQDAGRAIWTLSSTSLLVANGVIRYDATDFHGAASERDLDNCLAVLSTYDVPWRFSAWEHLGADVLVPQLVARGMIGTDSAQAMWLDLRGRRPVTASEDGIDVRRANSPSYHQVWTKIFTTVFGIPSNYTEVFHQMVARANSYGLVAYANGRPAGCLSIELEKGLAVVDNIGVLPFARRRGVCGRLLEAAHDLAEARGAKASVVVASPAASGVCTRLGYHAVTSVAYLTPAPLMVRRARSDV